MSLNQWTELLSKRPMDVFRAHAVSPPDQGELVTTFTPNPVTGVRTASYDPGFAKPQALTTDGTLSRYFRPGVNVESGSFRQAEVNRALGHIRLGPSNDPGLNGALTFDVKIRPAPDRIACYFLPWSSKILVEMTIPEKKTADDNPHTDPNMFFTAAINGCSVFVTGDPRRACRDFPGIDPYGGAAAAFWRDLVTTARAAAGIHSGKVYEINNTDYINQTGQSGKSQTVNADAYKRWLDSMPPGQFIVEEVNPWGCVFGIRFGRLWSFYLQENVRIKRYRFKRETRKTTFQRLVPKKNFFGKQKGYAVEEYEGDETVDVREDSPVNKTMLVRPFFPGPTPNARFLPKFQRL